MTVGARPDECLVDRLSAELRNGQPIAADGARKSDIRLERGQVDGPDVVVPGVVIRRRNAVSIDTPRVQVSGHHVVGFENAEISG